MSLFLPFNHRPSSTTVRTSSYSIPSGKYARVIVQVENGGSFSINGSTALTSDDGDVISVGVSSSNPSYVVPSGYTFVGQAGGGSVNGVTIDGNELFSTAGDSRYNQINAGGGSTVAVSSSGGTVYLTGYATKNCFESSKSTAEFWIPNGATINGSGSWRATVEEYDIV